MQSGDVAFDRFVIELEAGAGGMGTVYKARDTRTNDVVALKVMQAITPTAARRLEREAALIAELKHPAIVGYVAHGPSWIAMEWLDGEDLSQRLARQPLTLNESLALIRCVAAALGAAHRQGIIHRDIKPSNIWLVGGRVTDPKLLDFGIARGAAVNSSLTVAGSIIGTPAYMAPEQARGEGELDAHADVFSLGCVMFECLTGQPPFVGTTIAAVLAKLLLEEARRIGDVVSVPSEVDDLVAQMLAKDPAARPRDANEVMRALVELDVTEIGPQQPGAVALGRAERTLASAILIERLLDTATTVEASSDSAGGPGHVIVDGVVARYRVIAEDHGGRVEALADGSIAILIEGKAAPTDQARNGARCALALAASAPGGRIALATGRAIWEPTQLAKRLIAPQRFCDLRLPVTAFVWIA